ncbi:MFS transporter-like protein [Xylogone sp. PMI_703]|nr:MFS transporter-like protein [Xylogone sp. PMI_703]
MGDVEKAYEADGITPKSDVGEGNGIQSSNGSGEKGSLREEEAGQNAPTSYPIDTPPDGGYGWVCVACVFFINMSTWGLNSSYGVFLAHYLSNNTFPGATALDYAFVGGLSIAVALAVSPASTLCTRLYGTHVTLFTGIIFETGAVLGASWASKISHLFVTQGALFGIGMGFLFVGSVGIVPQWFTKRRSFANSVGTAGSGLGGLMYSLATNAMIQSIGLPWAFRVLAILAFTVNGIATILVRDRNKQVGAVHLPFDVRLFKRPEYLLVVGWGFFSMLGYVVLLFSLGNYASSIGLTAKQGSVVVAMLNLGQGLGRPVVGLCSDAAGRINLAGFCTSLVGLFCLVIWIFAKSYGVCIFFAVLVGTVAGVFWTTVAPVVTEVVGLQVLPSALSILWVVLAVPCTFAEPIGLELRTTTGDKYLHCQIFTGCMYLAGAVCLWFLRAWKIHDLEKQAVQIQQLEEERIDGSEGPFVSRIRSHATSVRSKAKVLRGLWAWQRV